MKMKRKRKEIRKKERKKRKHKLIHPDKQTARQQDKSSQDEIYIDSLHIITTTITITMTMIIIIQ